MSNSDRHSKCSDYIIQQKAERNLDKCEGCNRPAAHYDSERVPLCCDCLDSLVMESTTKEPSDG